jgi:predicted TIM-barrel fold metal-dependent hydrolase
MHSSEAYFERILEIIHFDGNRTEFAQRFFNICKAKAGAKILAQSPVKNNDELAQQIADNPDEYLKIFEEEVALTLKDYLASISTSLTTEEKDNLKMYLHELSRS